MTDTNVLAVWCEQLLWPQRRGLSHLLLPVPACDRPEQASAGGLLGPDPGGQGGRSRRARSAQGLCCPQRCVPEQAGGRGGREDAQGLPCCGATLLLHRSEDCSLSAQRLGRVLVPKDALLVTGNQTRTRQLPAHSACPPSFSFSIRQLDCLHPFFFFLSFSHAEIQPVPQTRPKAASLLLTGRPHAAGHPLGCWHPAQSKACPMQPLATDGLPCSFPSQPSPVQEGFSGLVAIFASFSVAGREEAGMQGSHLSHQPKPFTAVHSPASPSPHFDIRFGLSHVFLPSQNALTAEGK